MESLLIEKTFDAPIEKVWEYFSDPELYKRWWGPKYFSAPTVDIDFRVGGKILACMRGPAQEGEEPQDNWTIGTYKEIVEPSGENKKGRIVVTDSFSDENGNVVPSSTYGLEGFPDEMLVTLDFEETDDGKTKLSLKHEDISGLDDKSRSDMEQGWKESLDKLEESLSNN